MQQIEYRPIAYRIVSHVRRRSIALPGATITSAMCVTSRRSIGVVRSQLRELQPYWIFTRLNGPLLVSGDKLQDSPRGGFWGRS